MSSKTLVTQANPPKVQPPNYTQIPNILISLMPRMREAELRVVLAIARETFGWHRDEKSLSLTRLQGLTGLSRQGVLNGIEEGLKRSIIVRRTEGNSFTYRLLVNEVDRPAGQPGGPERSTSLTTPVHRADQKLVHVVDTAKKGLKKELNKRKTNHTQTRARARSKFDLATCERFAQTLPRLDTPDAYARRIFLTGDSDHKVEAWLSEVERFAATSVPAPVVELAGTPNPELLTALLVAVRERVNAKTYEQWFAPITLLTVEHDLIRLVVPDEMFRRWIQTNYHDVLEEATAEVGLSTHRVELWCAGEFVEMRSRASSVRSGEGRRAQQPKACGGMRG